MGSDRIEKILDGCAVVENWTAADGKEKTLVAGDDDGGVRFQGEIPVAGGGSYFDRTTLTPLPDGTVHQVIEVSRDGETWQAVFDAVYRRV